METDNFDEDINPPAELYGYHAVSSFANDTAMPYLGYFAVRLGASFEQIAWLQSLMNLLPNALQFFWGWISDTRLVRTYWIIGGSVIASFALFMLSTVQNPDEMIILDLDARDKGVINTELLKRISGECNMPLTFGGGIDSVEKADQAFYSGADKITINSAFFKKPEIIKKIEKYLRQSKNPEVVLLKM